MLCPIIPQRKRKLQAMVKQLKNYVSDVDQLLHSFREANNANPSVIAKRRKFVVTKDVPSTAGLQAMKQRQDRLDALRRKAGR